MPPENLKYASYTAMKATQLPGRHCCLSHTRGVSSCDSSLTLTPADALIRGWNLHGGSKILSHNEHRLTFTSRACPSCNPFRGAINLYRQLVRSGASRDLQAKRLNVVHHALKLIKLYRAACCVICNIAWLRSDGVLHTNETRCSLDTSACR